MFFRCDTLTFHSLPMYAFQARSEGVWSLVDQPSAHQRPGQHLTGRKTAKACQILS